MHPVIGIITCGTGQNRQFVSQPYIEAVESAGALPVLIPRVTDHALLSGWLSICHGFLFCGGDDICPLLFGEDLQTDRGHTDIATDLFQLSFMRLILHHLRPVFGICRGMQLLNVALGGSVWQDIRLRPSSSLNHMQISADRSEPSHKVSFQKGSTLHKICGDFLYTNSFHHQCVKTTGPGLSVSGRSSDGIAEALEHPAFPFCIGVQWHPECMYHSCLEMQDLFAAFVASTENPNRVRS